MERYSSYKDSGVPWIGEVPAAWGVERLRFLGALSGGGADKRVREGEALFHAAHYMNVYSAASKTLNPATFLRVSLPQEKAKALKLDVGDVLFTSSSETPEDIGHAAVVTEPLPEDSVYGYHLVRFRPASGVYDPSFERYFFESEAARTWLQYRANGITRYGVIGIDYSDYPALVPPLDEQRLIANYLDEKASAIDAAIQGAEESIARLREYRQSIINEAVTKGLNPDVPMKDSDVPWIGEIPRDWRIEKAKYLVDIRNGADPRTEGDTPVYGSGASSFRTCGETKEGPTVLLGRLGATLHIPHWIVGKYWNMNTAFDVHPKKDIFIVKYYYYLATCFDYRFYVSQNTLPIMGKTDYENMLIPIPPQSEQEGIVAYLDAMSSKIDVSIEELGRAVKQLCDYRQSLINEAVTGKIKVPGVEE